VTVGRIISHVEGERALMSRARVRAIILVKNMARTIPYTISMMIFEGANLYPKYKLELQPLSIVHYTMIAMGSNKRECFFSSDPPWWL
jgi:hypothetical protein